MCAKEIYIGRTNPTPIGTVWVAIGEKGLVRISMLDDKSSLIEEMEKRHHVNVILNEQQTEKYTRQIEEYLEGSRQYFDLPIDWSVMTPFQKKALKATYEIPRGQTRTYGEVAEQAGNPQAPRAVGRAEATNPIPIVIPCHRVVNADGELHGYSGHGGLETKAWLLELEAQE